MIHKWMDGKAWDGMELGWAGRNVRIWHAWIRRCIGRAKQTIGHSDLPV